MEGRPTNLSFELPGHLTTQAYSFVAANAAILEAWTRTSRASYGSDEEQFELTKMEVTPFRFVNCDRRSRALDKNGRPFTCWPLAVSYDQVMSSFAMPPRFNLLGPCKSVFTNTSSSP